MEISPGKKEVVVASVDIFSSDHRIIADYRGE
jgi:hypothetical protein